MYLCFVRHDISSKEYLFDCTSVRHNIWPGQRVKCQTIHGQSFGTVTTLPLYLEDCDCAKKLIDATSAYWPLKNIITVETTESRATVGPMLTNSERERVAKDWLSEKLGDLPF